MVSAANAAEKPGLIKEDLYMLTWLADNASTIIVCAVLVVIVFLIIKSMRKNKKQGKSSCGCGCANCAMSGMCHGKK